MSNDFFKSRTKLKTSHGEYTIFSLSALEKAGLAKLAKLLSSSSGGGSPLGSASFPATQAGLQERLSATRMSSLVPAALL